MKTSVTPQMVKAGFQTVLALADAIKELRSVPCGELYATVMSVMDLPTFESFTGHLLDAGLVRKENNVFHAEARELCQEWNDANDPGRYSDKAEFEEA